MKIGSVAARCGMMWLAAASGCTVPTDCPTSPSPPAVTLRVLAPGGVDVTTTARVEVTQNGVAASQFAVQYPDPGSDLIRVYGTGGSYSIIVYHAGYRDTTVTASVLDVTCSVVTVPLTVTLTAP